MVEHVRSAAGVLKCAETETVAAIVVY